MMPRDYRFGTDAKSKIFTGIELMNDTVSPTLGPCGRNAAVHLGKQVVLTTKDGVTVAEQVSSPDKWTEMGCEIVREASQNCNSSAGDGTTSAIVMTHSICKQALHLPEDINVIKVKNGMKRAVSTCVEEIKKMSKPCEKKEDFQKVAFISSQDGEIAEKVTEVFLQSGEHGAIDIEYSENPKMEIEHTDGFVMEKGWIMNHGGTVTLEDVPVLVTDKDIKHMQQILPVMDMLAKQGMKRLFIVCDNLSGEALGMLVNNINAGKFQACAVKVPSYGKFRIDIMRDICAVTGAQFISEEENINLSKISLEHLGRARRVSVERDRTIITSFDNIEIKKRMGDRIAELEELKKTELDDPNRMEVEKRLATLTNGVSVIHFGAQTEGERNERKHRITDSICAVRSAREEGVTIGGGSSYLKCIKALEKLKTDDRSEKIGIDMVKKSLRSIALRVLEVAGVQDKELIVSKIIEEGGNAGYDFDTGGIADMVKIGVIEPAKVIRCVIQNAASCAMTFLSLDVAIADTDEDPIKSFKSFLKS